MWRLVSLFIILISGSLSCFALDEISNDSLALRIKALESNIELMNKSMQNLKTIPDQISISTPDLKEALLLDKSHKSQIEIWGPILIALVVVLISSYSGYRIAKIQINKDISIASTQIETQEALAADQLRIAREQITESTKSALKQVKSNNILQARINWIQDLRLSISNFLEIIIPLRYHLINVATLVKNKDFKNATREYNLLIDQVGQGRSLAYQIRLHLTSQSEDHLKLDAIVDKIDQIILKGVPSHEFMPQLEEQIDSLLIVGKQIIKDTWEESKTKEL